MCPITEFIVAEKSYFGACSCLRGEQTLFRTTDPDLLRACVHQEVYNMAYAAQYDHPHSPTIGWVPIAHPDPNSNYSMTLYDVEFVLHTGFTLDCPVSFVLFSTYDSWAAQKSGYYGTWFKAALDDYVNGAEPPWD